MPEVGSHRKKALLCLLVAALLTVSVCTVVGCGAKEKGTVKIGAIYPLSGALATAGADVRNAVLLAADIINNEYDLDLPLARSRGLVSLDGARIEVIFGDSQGSPEMGRDEAERLIREENVVALIGCYQSAVTAEASVVAEESGVPFLAATSTAPSLTHRGLDWFFRTTPSDETFVKALFQFLSDVEQAEGVIIQRLALVHENSTWGSEVAELAAQYAAEYGYQIVETISYPVGVTDVAGDVQRVKDASPDVVVHASYVSDAILYMQTYEEMEFRPHAILANDAGFVEPEFLNTLGEDGNYILTREAWSKDLAELRPMVITVNQMFEERYGQSMNGNSARAFTGMMVLADAINRAGSTHPEAIRNALLETNIPADELIMPWAGVEFDPETHQNIWGIALVCQVFDEEYHVVWPWDLATRELTWPMPEWEEG